MRLPFKENADKWRSFEVALKNHRKVSPDDLAELYIELNNDLAYAQSCFAISKTAQYLNDLSIQAHNTIYKNRKERSSSSLLFGARKSLNFFPIA